MKYPKKKVIVNRIEGYIQRLEETKNDPTKSKGDALFILKRLLLKD